MLKRLFLSQHTHTRTRQASLRDEMKRLKDLSELEIDSNNLKKHLEEARRHVEEVCS